MRHLVGRAAGPAIMLAAAVVVASCGSAATPSPANAIAPAAPNAVPLADLRTHPIELRVVIDGGKFSTTTLEAPADTPFRITLENRDPGTPHGLAIQRGAPVDGVALSSEDLFEGQIFSGPASQSYEVPPMAPGTYTFACLVYPDMVGTLVVR